MNTETVRDRSNRSAEAEVYRPQSETELVELLKQFSADKIPVTIAAARTALTGSCVPSEGVVVDVMNLAPVESEPSANDLNQKVFPPTILIKDLDEVLAQEGLVYLPTPGYKQCSLGGTVATNASGPRTFSFGATRDHVWFIRVVLMDGEILELHRGEHLSEGEDFEIQSFSGKIYTIPCPNYVWSNVKNATGLYAAKPLDLIDLFIGSEGLLGVITQVGVLTHKFSSNITTEAYFFTSQAAASQCVEALREYGFDREKMTGFISLEFMDQGALQLSDFTDFGQYEAAIEIEYFSGDQVTQAWWQAEQAKYDIPATLMGEDVPRFRYSIPLNLSEKLREYGTIKVASDFAVPVKNFPAMWQAYSQAMQEFEAAKATDDVTTAIWGHIGDCHLHLNFIPQSAEQEQLAQQLYLRLAETCVELGGVLSAEHGTGKKQFVDGRSLLDVQNSNMREDIQQIKKSLDPLNLLNRGNMISA